LDFDTASTPLYEAAYDSQTEIVRVLIEEGVDVNELGDDSWWPIHAAFDNAEIVSMLLAAGADPNTKTGEAGQTTLYLASKWNKTKVIEMLLKKSPEPKDVESAFDIAIALNSPESAQM